MLEKERGRERERAYTMGLSRTPQNIKRELCVLPQPASHYELFITGRTYSSLNHPGMDPTLSVK